MVPTFQSLDLFESSVNSEGIETIKNIECNTLGLRAV